MWRCDSSPVCQSVCSLLESTETYAITDTQVKQFDDHSAGDDSVKCRSKVHIVHLL